MASSEAPVFDIAKHNLGRGINIMKGANPGILPSPNEELSLTPAIGFDPFDQSTLEGSSFEPIVLLDSNGAEESFNDKVYTRPLNTVFTTTGVITGHQSLTVDMGEKLITRFETEAGFSAKYSGLSGTAGAQYSSKRTFSTDTSYALYTFAQDLYSLRLNRDLHEWIEPKLLADARELPAWARTQDVYDSYARFFAKWGTHIIRGGFAGTRYQLKVELAEMRKERKDAFEANVKFDFKEILGGSGSHSSGFDYQAYCKSARKDTKALGGNRAAAAKLQMEPSKENFDAWADTFNENKDNLVRAELLGLGTLLEESPKREHRDLAQGRLLPAVDYVSSFRTRRGMLYRYYDQENPSWQFAEFSIPSVPGVRISAENVSGWSVDTSTPGKLRVTRQQSRWPMVRVPVTITFPGGPLDVHFDGDCPGTQKSNSIVLQLLPFLLGPDTEPEYQAKIWYGKMGPGVVNVPRDLDAWGVVK